MDVDPKAERALRKRHAADCQMRYAWDRGCNMGKPFVHGSHEGTKRGLTPSRSAVYADIMVSSARQITTRNPNVSFCIENPQPLNNIKPDIQHKPRLPHEDCQYKSERWPKLDKKSTNLWTPCSCRPLPTCNKMARICGHRGKQLAQAQLWYADSETC